MLGRSFRAALSTLCRWNSLRLRNEDESRRNRTNVRQRSDTSIDLTGVYDPLFFSVATIKHAQITRELQVIDPSVSRQFADTATRAAALTRKRTRRRQWTACLQAHAESSLDVSHQIIDDVPKRYRPVFVAIDETAIRQQRHDTSHEVCSQLRPSPLFAWERIMDSEFSHRKDRFQWDVRFGFARTERGRIGRFRVGCHSGFPDQHLFHYTHDFGPQILCKMEQRALALQRTGYPPQGSQRTSSRSCGAAAGAQTRGCTERSPLYRSTACIE